MSRPDITTRLSKQLLDRLAELTGKVIDVDFGPTSDTVDIAAITDTASVQATLAEHDSGEVELILEALGRMQSGTYGVCARCSKKIPMARLRAMPWALNCIDCQRLSENGRVKLRG